MASDASHMLEAALEQMDDIIAGTKAVTEYTNGGYDIGSPIPVEYLGTLSILNLVEELRMALEMLENPEEREILRNQIPGATSTCILGWLASNLANHSTVNNETYQERLTRLEGDKESLILQVSVLTDQVEAQGEKIRDLETCVEEHHLKLNATEGMLQQELLSRTSLETQKLDLMTEVSGLKIKLAGLEKEQNDCEERQSKVESVFSLIRELQEQMRRLQQEINNKFQERKPQDSKSAITATDGPDNTSPVIEVPQQEEFPHCGTEHAGEGLLQELKSLKFKVEELENERAQYEWKLKATKLSISYSLHVCYQSLMSQLSSLQVYVEQLQAEKLQWEEKCKTAQAEIAQLQEQLALKDAEIERLKCQISSRTLPPSENTERELFKRRLKEKHQEVQRLKIGMESLLSANEEKDRRIEELTVLLSQYRRVKDFMMAAHGSAERTFPENTKDELEGNSRKWGPTNKPPTELFKPETFSSNSTPAAASPLLPETKLSTSESIPVSSDNQSSPHEEVPEIKDRAHQKKVSSSLEDLHSGSLEKHVDETPVEPVLEPENKPHLDDNRSMTLPGRLPQATLNGEREISKMPTTQNVTREKSHKEENSIQNLNLCRSASAPLLGDSENSMDVTVTSNEFSPYSSGMESGPQSPVSPENRRSPKGIKKFWGKIKRTQSGNFHTDDLGLSEFRRGGLRATAGPRLSRSKDTKGQKSDSKAPFAQWNNEQVCNWLEDFGLVQYVIFARQWVNSGHTLLTATPQDLEKELGIKHPLHRKKLLLALKCINAKQEEKSGQLDHVWVTRWLDDIGLPQYKDQFHEARVDGRMLQYLTVNDLLFLKVTSQLHHLSIKCAIHVLHANKFNPHCLRRRPVDENNISPSEIVQWSNHRVMEWLRSVDLAEYAPNLRGSGVHGGLIILEPHFNSDTLAMLLNIPPQKTLLRRHLSTNFIMLIGRELQREKRESMDSASYTPLTTTAKVRPKKLGFSHFGHLRKKKFDDSTDYVCPMDANQNTTNGVQRSCAGMKGLSPISNRELEQMEHSEGTVIQIGAFSQDINNLTNMLSEDEILNNCMFLPPPYEDWR
ncbi:LOW QUALITY PROTEIN: liprin-beta-2 [Microcaecilia unicolor]|uniref:LOW QUALITY PROTEIN: liprin-beta-2 n=1 Tax=Microcaecilia unicolor TaxID=1415580 RepID=A0A6P7XN73_9AMPH|nr:LOW QUALITY PROTEIN: liprin-beta-2 [Microcaecilia unicolor]